MSPDPHEQLTLKRELNELDRLAAWVQAIEQRMALPPAVAFALELCLEEAVANIIMYGDASGHGDIAITLEQASGRLLARIEDDGWQFDPTTAAQRVPPRSLDDAKVGELGIHLMRTFASDMRYERKSGYNTLTLTFAAAAGA
ncbi:MAG: ATP-binding protein [Xanthobacteraceae bacterium]|jgi:serine/threonine-protein kinase RsbW